MPIVSGVTHTLRASDEGTRVRLHVLVSPTVTVLIGSTEETWTPGSKIEVVNHLGSYDTITFGGDAGVTVNSYPDGEVALAPGEAATVYCVSATEFDVQKVAKAPNLTDYARLSEVNVFSAAQVVAPAYPTGSGLVSFDCTLSNTFFFELTGSTTITMTGAYNGQIVNIIVRNAGTGLETLSFDTSMLWAGGVVPTNTQEVGAVDLIVARYSSDLSSWLCTMYADFKAAALPS